MQTQQLRVNGGMPSPKARWPHAATHDRLHRLAALTAVQQANVPHTTA
jgi:hypothetical protein